MKSAIGAASSPVVVEPGGGERFLHRPGGFVTHMLIVQLPGDEFSVDFFPKRLTSVKQATILLAPRAFASAALLNKELGNTMRGTSRFLRSVCGLSITPGGLA